MKTRMTLATILAVTVLQAGQAGQTAQAAPTKLGNGDDGMDLEGTTPITAGPIVDARKKALELLNKLNTAGVTGLGALAPELETSPLYMAKQDTGATLPEDQGAFHSDMRGLTFARTFATPHAATRFFPAAVNLTEAQLVALEIHEALHRSLPPGIREQEPAVAAITLAITAPGATHDQLADTAARILPPPPPVQTAVYSSSGSGTPSGGAFSGAPSGGATIVELNPPSQDSRINQPSLLGYTYRVFEQPKTPSTFPVTDMHVLETSLYPFGGSRTAFGVGIQASLIDLPGIGGQMGPLGISARLRLWSKRGFDVGIWGQGSLNMLSTDEMKNSPLGRDVYTVGISMRKDLQNFYIENFLSYSAPSTATQTLGQVQTTYSYGGITNLSMHAGGALSKLKLGGFVEIYLADDYNVSTQSASFTYDTGRYRVVSGGPEVAWMDRDFSIALQGRFLINSTQNASFDTLGEIMGAGVGQGALAGTVSIYF